MTGSKKKPNVRVSGEAEQELMLSVRRQEKKVIRFAFLVVLSSLVYAFVVNLLYLGVKELPAYKLQMKSNLPAELSATYSLSVNWDVRTAGDANSHPTVLLDSHDVVPVAPQNGIMLNSGDEHTVTFVIPVGCPPGRHTGSLVAMKTSGPNHLEEVLDTPIELDISAGVWSNWKWALSGGGVAILMVVVLYVLCMLLFPKPSGKLEFKMKAGKGRLSDVLLNMSRSGWLFPWRRSVIPISTIWKLSGAPGACVKGGELFFCTKSAPPFLYLYSSRRTKFKMLSQEDERRHPFDREAGAAIGVSCRLWEEIRWISYSESKHGPIILFRYMR